MKKPLAFLLVCIHLAGNTEAGQVFRLPSLIRHFHTHQNADPSISFIRFLIMHYAGDDGTKADDNDDAKLPFHDYTHSSISAIYAPMVKAAPVTDIQPAPGMGKEPEKIDRMPVKHIMKILQPPRYS